MGQSAGSGLRGTRGRTVVSVLAGAVAALLLVAVAVIGWRALPVSLRLSKTDQQCTPDPAAIDPTASGLEQWCVERHHRDAGLFTDEATELHVTLLRDGVPAPRYTVLPYPFLDHDAPLQVRFGPDRIVVRDQDTGSEIAYPGSVYALD